MFASLVFFKTKPEIATSLYELLAMTGVD